MQLVVCLCVQITSATPLKHPTSLSAMFVYIRVPPNNPINGCAHSFGPRLSLFSEVSYCIKPDEEHFQVFDIASKAIQKHNFTLHYIFVLLWWNHISK